MQVMVGHKSQKVPLVKAWLLPETDREDVNRRSNMVRRVPPHSDEMLITKFESGCALNNSKDWKKSLRAVQPDGDYSSWPTLREWLIDEVRNVHP